MRGRCAAAAAVAACACVLHGCEALAAGATRAASNGGGLVVGVNKYSHDVSICVCTTAGQQLFAGEKERITRAKHDGGDAGELVEHALDCIGASVEDVQLVVSNNHHYRVAPFEKRLPWSVGMGLFPPSYLHYNNLLPNAKHVELSHHLAHAWGTLSQAPFDDGLVVVMDGMGESYGGMAQSMAADETDYMHDLLLQRNMASSDEPAFQQVPQAMQPHAGYREAETAYLFDKRREHSSILRPVFKRWTKERSPPELYNHGFENMESMGAVYSRVSSQVFGDWNSCGKVMGLAPWAGMWPQTEKGEGTAIWTPAKLMEGSLLAEEGTPGAFRINWDALDSLPHVNKLKEKALRPYYAALSHQVQTDLEAAAMDFVTGLRQRTGARHLCLCGGVVLNSVLNGRIMREAGFERVHIPNHPGDEGISMGCAAYGVANFNSLMAHGVQGRNGPATAPSGGTKPFATSRSPYQGKAWTDEEVDSALSEFSPWIEVQQLADIGSPQALELAADTAAELVAGGNVVGWFQGRSEFGPRALGSRSLLADPRDGTMIDRINLRVKLREDFRPFAPSVLSENAKDWFDGLTVDGSPYMSLTVPAKADKRDQIPAVCHVDSSARIQTLSEPDNPLYHRLISKFHSLTGVPMVLNTSFNIKGEPIVDSPEDALRSFLNSGDGMDALVMHHHLVKRKPFPLDATPEQATAGQQQQDAHAHVMPRAVGPFVSDVSTRDNGDVIRVRIMLADGMWVDLDDDMQLAVLEAVDGLTTVAELCEDAENEDVLAALRALYHKRVITL